jgi:hypothetical protein
MKFWSNERGPTGDHGQAGQDGREGRRGETGERGPAGVVVDGKQGERGQRGRAGGSTPGLRMRMLILYLVTITLLVWVGVSQVRSEQDRRHFQRAVVANCLANRQNTVAFNRFIDTLTTSYNKSRVLTAKEKAERIAFFDAAKGKVPTCPPSGGGRP